MGGGGFSNLDPTSSKFMGGYGQYTPWSTRYYTDQGWKGGKDSDFGRGTSAGGKAGKAGSSGAPSAPDFYGLAERELQANRPTQYNAFGSETSWTTDANGNPVQTQSFGGPLGDASRSLMSQVAANAGQPIGTGDQAREAATKAYYERASSRLDPAFQRREDEMRARLAAQGLDPGSAAYGNDYDVFNRGRNDAYATAEREAQTAGNQAQDLTFRQNVVARQEPLNELGQLRGFTSMPGFMPANFMRAGEAQYGGDLQRYGIDQAAKNSKMSGGANVGAAALMASDEAIKAEIERLDVEVIPGVRLARWKWRDGGSPGLGVVAQDVERVRPDLVERDRDGVLCVNYAGLVNRDHHD